MSKEKADKRFFTKSLIQWHEQDNDRSLPWKEEKDPYKIWLSEIILQQTRAMQGLPYYTAYTDAYPTVMEMAAAEDDEVFRLWQGLGYYNRCRNMLATARYIANELNGNFPDTYEGLLNLKGVGPYTAAAIASFAFSAPNAVIDGNVYRVLSRYFGIETPYDTTEGKKLFAALAQELLWTENSAAYNQAIMDLGATVCTPKRPLCAQCPLAQRCQAKQLDIIDVLPVKSKKQTVTNKYFHYLILTAGDEIWLKKRTGKGIWQNLYEPYLIEAGKPLSEWELAQSSDYKKLSLGNSKPQFLKEVKQRLTHQLITFHFYKVATTKTTEASLKEGNWVKISALSKYAMPKTLVSLFENLL